MSPKQRFPVMLEPSQLSALKAIESKTGARVSEQIRRAIDQWLESSGEMKSDRKRAGTRKRP
jgi:hypothetical protein